ncbi:hypothetical protein ACFFP0_25375 [Rhizobium puerariae]|uniref:DUF3168 domain-containing protein n=1 Tax=Rhizobium puerariae TaxID=1585791 RepID=A0ABV6ANJ8_9HYPH
MTVFSAIEKPLRTLGHDRLPMPTMNTAVDAVAYLTKLHLTIGKGVAPFVFGRVWNAHEVPKNPAWPFIVIADAKKEYGAVSITIEAWGRWTPETTAIADAIKHALPASFEHVSTGFQRPGNSTAGSAVASITFRREIG